MNKQLTEDIEQFTEDIEHNTKLLKKRLLTDIQFVEHIDWNIHERNEKNIDWEHIYFFLNDMENKTGTHLNYLGFMYHYGLGICKNKERSIIFYKKAVEKGNLNSMFNLAVLYQNTNPRLARIYRTMTRNGNHPMIHEVEK